MVSLAFVLVERNSEKHDQDSAIRIVAHIYPVLLTIQPLVLISLMLYPVETLSAISRLFDIFPVCPQESS